MKTQHYALLFLTFICILTLVSADESFVFKQGQNFTIDVAVSNNNLSECLACTCKVSIFYPNGTALVRNDDGTMVDGYCQYTTSSEVLGNHGVEILSTNTVDHGRATFEVVITYTGDKLTLQTVAVYIFSIIVLLIFFGLILLLITRLPSKDATDENGVILQISNLKHLRPVLWGISWGIILGLMYIVANITIAYLPTAMIGNLFWAFFVIMFWTTMVALPLWFAWIFTGIFRDKEFKRMIERGVDIKSTP